MREIEFRGKVKNIADSHSSHNLWDGTWVYGDLEVHRGDGRTLIHCYHEDERYYRQYDVDESTIGQYTGLTDSTGTKIYEGDIVHFVNHDDDVEEKYRRIVSALTYDKGSFLVNFYDNFMESLYEYATDVDRTAEVIGNIYDNPELLNK